MKNYKKILIVTSEFPPQPGGIGTHAFNVAKQLTRNSFSVIVLTNTRSKQGKIEVDFDKNQEFKIVRVQRERFTFFTYLNRWRAYIKLTRLETPDTIMASGKFSLWLVGLFTGFKKIKKVAIIHGSEVNLSSRWEQLLVNTSLKQMKIVIAVSNFTMQLLAPLNLNSIEVIINGFDSKHFQLNSLIEKNGPDKKPVLITVGALSKRKGQHNVLRALPILRKRFPSIHYHMVGIPIEKENLETIVHESAIEDLTTFHDVLDQRKMVQLLSYCDIFVMLSEETIKGEVEGFGIAVLEANYMGLPAIGSLHCGIEDAIDDHKSGILIPHNDATAFEQALEEIMNNKIDYAKNAKKWAEQYTWELVIEKYIEVLNK